MVNLQVMEKLGHVTGVVGKDCPRHAKTCLRAYADSDYPGLRFPVTESLDTIECISGEQMLE